MRIPQIEMMMAEQQLQRGDVVAYAGRYFVAWHVDGSNVDAFPIRLASDFYVVNFTVDVREELSSWGITGERGVVCAGERELLIGVPQLRIIRVGRCSGGLICRIVGQAARAFVAQSATDAPQVDRLARAS